VNLQKNHYEEAASLAKQLGHTDIPTQEFFNKLGFKVHTPYRKHFIQDVNDLLKENGDEHLEIDIKQKGNPPKSTVRIRNTEQSYADRAINKHRDVIQRQGFEDFYREYINRENQTLTGLVATTHYLLQGGKKKHVAQDFQTTPHTIRQRIKDLAEMDYAPYPLQEKAQQELQEDEK